MKSGETSERGRRGSEPVASRLRRELPPLGALLAFTAAVVGPYFARCYASWVPGGWDGVAHFSVAELYARKVFPALSGWLPEYFAGLPFPDFYPPLFYFLVALPIRAGVPPAAAFLGFQTLATLALPLAVYLCGRRLSGSRAGAFAAGAVSVAFLVDSHPVASFGVTLQATFGIGLSTQLSSFVFTLLFYFFFLDAERSRAAAALAAVFLAAVALTNVHVVWDAACLFVGLAGARIVAARSGRQRWRSAGRSAAVGALAVGLSACWVVPMLARLEFVPTLALPPPPAGLVLHAFFRLGVYLVLGVVAAWAEGDARALGLGASLVLLLAFASFPATDYLADLALQPGRFLVAFMFLTPILVGYLVASVRRLTPRPWVRGALALGMSALFFAYVDPVDSPMGNISAEQAADYRPVLAALAGRTDGRTLVEMGTGSPSDSFALQALVGRAGGHSLTTVFRESALAVLFAAPLRNAYSTRQDTFGTDSKIPGGRDLAAQPVPVQLARLRLFAVRYFAVKTAAARQRVAALPGVERLSPPGRWEAWALPEPAAYAEVPRLEPVLTFARFSVKRRPEGSVDFIRLAEEMFTLGRLEPLLVRSRRDDLDRSEDWERFGAALVVDYRHRDLERAYGALERFSRDRPLVLLEADDPLYRRIAALAPERPHLRLVPRGGGGASATAAEVCRRLLATLAEVVPERPAGPAVASVEVAGPAISVTLDRPPERAVPLWIKQGYLPNWRAGEGAVYLATPAFQVVFATADEVHLRYRPLPAAWIGAGVSLASLAVLAGALAGPRLRGRARRRGTAPAPGE